MNHIGAIRKVHIILIIEAKGSKDAVVEPFIMEKELCIEDICLARAVETYFIDAKDIVDSTLI